MRLGRRLASIMLPAPGGIEASLADVDAQMEKMLERF